MVVVLLGYMASGKSTIGRILAKNLNYTFIDLDDYIEEKEKNTISDIFKFNGEIYFRKVETIYLKEVIEQNNNIVLSLGGGTPCYSNNINVLLNNENVTTIYLKATVTTLVNRLEKEKTMRPLISHLAKQDDLMEFVGKHLFERSSYYNQANITITLDGKQKEETLEDILLNLF